MTEEIEQKLCRVYTIPCPACGTDNRYPRLKMDIYRVKSQEPDGHPLEYSWIEKGDYPIELTPLSYFWASCSRCYYTAQLDDAVYRQWKKKGTAKYLAMYHDDALESLSRGADTGQNAAQALGKGIQPQDVFGTLLAQFYLGIFTECLKSSPAPSILARSYLRVAWILRDEERLFGVSAGSSTIRDCLSRASGPWKEGLPPNSDYPLVPEIAVDEIGALRLTLACFEWNFSSLQEASLDDEMRLMTLIAEIGYRVYELTDQEEDFKKALSLFSGAMAKCMSVINDKNIVGGAVNRAKDFLEKAGDRGRELRALKERREKGLEDRPQSAEGLPPQAPSSAPAPEAQEPAASPSVATEVQVAEEASEPAPSGAPVAVTEPAPSASGSGNLQEKIAHLDEENKRWMRLAGISEVSGLPNKVMLFKVMLPGAFKQAVANRQPLGCIFISPEGMIEINGKLGRSKGDLLIKKFSECIKESIKRGERLCHLEGTSFALVVPGMPQRQLRKRAEALHKDLTSRRFDLQGDTVSIKVNIGISGLDNLKGITPKDLQRALYSQGISALDTAKHNGSPIEVHVDKVPS